MSSRRIVLRLAAVAAFSAAVAAGAYAQNSAKGPGDTGTPGAAGQKVAIDKQTGKLRAPTPEESRKLSAAMQKMINRSTSGLTVVQHANGMKSVNLEGRFQSLAVGKKDANGDITESCVTNKAEAGSLSKTQPKKSAEVQ